MSENNSMNKKYESQEICIVVPTRNRPAKIINMLESLVKQKSQPGRVIIVASGNDIKKDIQEYFDKLPIEYIYTDVPGQIRQRKLGISKLDSSTRLVATLDDDIVLEETALKNIINFWNSTSVKTAGVGFNIVNIKENVFNPIKSFFFAGNKKPGKVLKSGFVTNLTNVGRDIKTDWLNGGATTWRQDIIIQNIHKDDIQSKWAPCEDLIFSYPVGKKYELYVCSNARVIHDDVENNSMTFSQNFERGKMFVYWHLYFIKCNSELSYWKNAVAVFITSTAGLFRSFLQKKWNKAGFYIGEISGLFAGHFHLFSGQQIEMLIK